MGPRSSFWVVLHRESGDIECRESFNDIIVQTHVAYLHLPKASGRLHDPLAGRVDRETMVLRGDLNFPRCSIDNRLIDAAMSILQLVGIEPQRSPQELITKANPKEGQPVPERTLQERDVVITGGRVTRAI